MNFLIADDSTRSIENIFEEIFSESRDILRSVYRRWRRGSTDFSSKGKLKEYFCALTTAKVRRIGIA